MLTERLATYAESAWSWSRARANARTVPSSTKRSSTRDSHGPDQPRLEDLGERDEHIGHVVADRLDGLDREAPLEHGQPVGDGASGGSSRS